MQQVPVDSILWVIHYIGEKLPIVGALIVLTMIDIATGIAAAAVKREVNSTVSRNGMIRKAVVLLLVTCGRVIEPYSGQLPVSAVLGLWFIFTEVISICENADRCGVDLPAGMKEYFKSMRRVQEAAVPAPSVQMQHVSHVDITVPAETKPGESGIMIGRDGK